ncbi:tRNA 2-selenouridine(34) synthase MnmH [Bacillus sp. B15-48]|uniref:tRNA 2-selenouridine(34) synthase MnmH n=1 Tax=Bacillus sp. B15-48 TaxID=1548601 RepID=UPI0019400FC9|nr:tRNA 2-selenouridine(34) synthase MnmH [Bacillus sp. B15-48]MBM4761965.1 tRNA 2-selenouridine(34) synthase MnmH [Bacillus sp. B15-48]
MKDIKVDELVQSKGYIPVDVRSPIEYAEAAIPGSVNIPLFTNEERQEIGIIYKNEGNQTARWRAMEIVTPKLPSILSEIKNLETADAKTVIYCWRGGSRSKSVATFFELAGHLAIRLDGGYRAYRNYILEQIPKLLPSKAIILHGLTGTGKTNTLKWLQDKGYPVVNLEEIANHRGSLFGSIGIGEGFNQKTFDALLFQRLLEIKGADYFIVEAESKRIGRASQPQLMLERKASGFHFLIQCSYENRIERIFSEYVLPHKREDWFHTEIREKLNRIEKRIKKPDIIQSIKQAVSDRSYKDLISILLTHYYDPKYLYTLKDYSGDFICINGDDSEQAASEIVSVLDKI